MFLSVREMELKKIRFETTFRQARSGSWKRSFGRPARFRRRAPPNCFAIRTGDPDLRRLKVRVEAECDRCLEPPASGRHWFRSFL